jgi:type I restriction enzyme S subunit
VKEGWDEKSLGDLCELYQPKTITKKEMTASGPYPVFGANGIIGHYHDFNHAEPQLMIGCRGACGTVNVSSPNSWITGNSMVVRPKDGRVDLDFLRHFFEGPAQLEKTVTGAAQPQITRTSLSPVRVPLPPLEEQHRIVSVLDEAFEALARARVHAEVNLGSARELFENFATRIFSQILKEHGQTTLGEVCEFIKDGTHQTPTYFDYGFIFLSAKNVKNGRLDWEDLKYIDEAQHFAMQKRLAPRLGDLLIRKNGAGYGAAALVDRDVIFDVYVSLAVLRPKTGILPEYLLQFANSSFAQSQFKDRIKGQGVPNLHLQEIKQVKIPLPKDISIQHDIASRLQTALEVVRLVETTYQNKLQDLADLRQSLLQKAFAGELT